jgi:predicted transcriptional regulator
MNYQQKEAVKQLRAERQSYSQIATILGISENTVKSYCRRNSLSGIAFTTTESTRNTCCRQCGAPLKQITGKKQKQYCSDHCRMLWWNDHAEAVTHKKIRRFNCQTCGRKFYGYGKRERKYCSRACYGMSKAVQA